MLLREAVELYVRDNNFSAAAEMLEELVRVDPTPFNKARLVKMCAEFDVQRAETYARQLPAVGTCPRSAEELERSIAALPVRVEAPKVVEEPVAKKR